MVTSSATAKPATDHGQIDTKKVTERREVHFDSYDELVADAERLASSGFRTVGNWSYGQILDHVVKSMNAMIEGGDYVMPAPLRVVMRLLMKKKMLSKTMSPGFKIPKAAAAVLPEELTVDEGLSRLKSMVARAKSETKRGLNPVFGKLTKEEWDQFQLRHCEMHMSFVVPANNAT